MICIDVIIASIVIDLKRKPLTQNDLIFQIFFMQDCMDLGNHTSRDVLSVEDFVFSILQT